MPVERFRSIEEMNAAQPGVQDEGGQAAFERFARHCARYWRMSPRIYPRGVFRFRGIEDAQAARTDHHGDVKKGRLSL